MYEKYKKQIVFLVHSSITGLIYIGLLFFMSDVLKTGMVISVSVAYAVAMVYYYITSKLIVFKEKENKFHFKELIQFIIVVTINYIITLLIVALLKHFTHEIFSGSIVAGMVTTTLTYVLFDKILFKSVRKTQSET